MKLYALSLTTEGAGNGSGNPEHREGGHCELKTGFTFNLNSQPKLEALAPDGEIPRAPSPC
jgi:hypothetical protein